MKLNVHLNFGGNAAEAFAFYEKALGKTVQFKMTWGEAPAGAPMPAGWSDKIMHISLPLGSGILMGCDAPLGSSAPIGGVQVSVEVEDQAEVKRIYEALSEDGSVQMPLEPTFWSPLFGMCTDKFGVAWMVGVLGGEPPK